MSANIRVDYFLQVASEWREIIADAAKDGDIHLEMAIMRLAQHVNRDTRHKIYDLSHGFGRDILNLDMDEVI